MKSLAIGLLSLVSVVLQLTLSQRLLIHGASPNLVVLAVVLVSWVWGARAGIAASVGAGLCLDLAGTGPLGVHALALLLAAWSTVFLVRVASGASWLPIAAAAASCLYGSFLVAALDGLGAARLGPGVGVGLILGTALVDALLAAPPALALARMHRALPLPS